MRRSIVMKISRKGIAAMIVAGCLLLSLFVNSVIGQEGERARDEKTEELFKKIESKVKELKTYKAEVSITMEMMGQPMTMKGSLVFKLSNKMKTDMDLPMPSGKQLMISDGKVMWTYMPKMNMGTRIDMDRIKKELGKEMPDKLGSDISKPFSGLKSESIRYVGTEKLNGEDAYVFEGLPSEQPQVETPFMPSKIKLWVGVKDGLLHKITMYGKEGKEMMSQSFRAIEVNIPIDDSVFVFTPPEGTQIVDMTEGTLNIMRAMKTKKTEEGECEEK